MLSNDALKLISNSLVNIFDWDSENLEGEFVAFLKHELPFIEERKLESLFLAFNKIPPKIRMSVDFDHEEFVRSQLDF